MESKKVTVIMSTKDTEKNVLKQSIDSILNQSYSNFEFLITCDGSESDYKILKEYDDNRIKIIKHKNSVGLTKSLNEMLKLAKGEYIARMDSDDISLKDRLKIEVNYLEKNEKVDICSTYFKFIDNKNDYAISPFIKSEEKKAELFIVNRICHPAVMMRKSFLKKNNVFYDENFKYTQDYELWSRVNLIANIAVIPKICLLYRVHDKQISTAKLKEQSSLCKKIYLRNLKNLKIKNPQNYIKYMMYLNFQNEDKIAKNEVKQFINMLLEKNKIEKIYNPKIFSKVLYYRFFAVFYKKFNIYELLKYLIKADLIKIYLLKTCRLMLLKFNIKKN